MVIKNYYISELKVGSWNINGVFKRLNGFRYNKLQNEYCVRLLQSHHIFGIIETHHLANEIHELHVSGYNCFNTCRPKSMQISSKVSGGLAVYVRDDIRRGVQKLSKGGSENICLKLNKEFFSTINDIYLVFSYCGPSNSQVIRRARLDVYDDLSQLLSEWANMGDLLVTGDFNTRVGQMFDYITEECNQFIPTPPSTVYEIDTIATSPRHSMDMTVNASGHKLIELCKTVPLRILNGRKLGDNLGNYTCYTPNGQSVVDYALCSPSLFHNIPAFSIGSIIPVLSDHTPVSFNVKVRACGQIDTQLAELSPLPDKVTWDKQLADRFTILLQAPAVKDIMTGVTSQGVTATQTGVDATAKLFSDILIGTATTAQMSVKKGIKPKQRVGLSFVKVKPPKWHDSTCEQQFNLIKQLSSLLHKSPKDPWVRGRLTIESKHYKDLLKKQQSKFVNKIFDELESIENHDPRGYFELIKMMKSGSFDKTKQRSTDSINPSEWLRHFKDLLGKKSVKLKEEEALLEYVQLNRDKCISELDNKFTEKNVLDAIKSLKNNKASSFDSVLNEMLKCGANVLSKALVVFFNVILDSNLYPQQWKSDILGPLHKSGPLDDPNNFRGICVSSCLGKLFNTLLRQKLDNFCSRRNLISKFQGSGKPNSRTADHLMVLRFIVDRFVKGESRKVYACFYDLRKAFDTVNRPLLFYNLLLENKIGGKFLAILENIYTDNEISVKVAGGITKPFTTTTGVKQGCVLSPCIFNLFINKIPEIYDSTCDLLHFSGTPLPALIWADDLVCFSLSAVGLKNAISKTKQYFDEMHLSINTKKTKVMIFNKGGKVLNENPEHVFYCGDTRLEVVGQYTYLGIIVKPSGSFNSAVDELHTKSTKAWFSISNFIYQNKKMAVNKSLSIFDMLVKPISMYCSELTLPFLFTESNFENKNFLGFWENFKPELLNQKISRMLLSVQKKASRLAVLGELERYPLLLSGLSNMFNYEHKLQEKSADNSVISLIFKEMEKCSSAGIDCWLTRVRKIKDGLGITLPENCNVKFVTPQLKKQLHSKFEKFWLENINKVVIKNGHDSNKLRFYKLLKGSFKQEPYLTLVKNRNQRCQISRLRISAHHLAVETSRYSKEYIPPEQRKCIYCNLGCPDTEVHFLTQCRTFDFKRRCYFGKLLSLGINIEQYDCNSQAAIMLCPTTAKQTKLSNKFIEIMFRTRKEVDEGATIESIKEYNLNHPTDQYSEIDSTLDCSLDSNFIQSDTDD